MRVRPAFAAAALTFDAMALAVAEVLGDVEADTAAEAAEQRYELAREDRLDRRDDRD